jgi:hypothetical protein
MENDEGPLEVNLTSVVKKNTLSAKKVIANVLKMYNLKYVSKKGLEDIIAKIIEKDLYDSGHL